MTIEEKTDSEHLENINFWIRLKEFVENVQVSDMPSEEEKNMILSICKKHIK